MALRELLSSSQREALEAIPVDRAGLIEYYVLGDQDLSLIRRRRRAQNRLCLAVQLAILRYRLVFPPLPLALAYITFRFVRCPY
jgi:hypothetical protein